MIIAHLHTGTMFLGFLCGSSIIRPRLYSSPGLFPPRIIQKGSRPGADAGGINRQQKASRLDAHFGERQFYGLPPDFELRDAGFGKSTIAFRPAQTSAPGDLHPCCHNKIGAEHFGLAEAGSLLKESEQEDHETHETIARGAG